MNKRGAQRYGSMAERVAATRRTASSDVPAAPNGATPGNLPAPPPSRPPVERLKHCWVTDQHGRLPGLLLEWRQVVAGWQGRVVHPVPDPDPTTDGWILVEEWLPAERLEST